MSLQYYFAACLLFLVSKGIFYGKKEKSVFFKASQGEAESYCRQKSSSLLRYSDLVDDLIIPEYLAQVNNGESVWIEGGAVFSPFMSWVGCFEIDHKNLKRFAYRFELEQQSLFLCLKKCNSTTFIGYIGMSGKMCFCIIWRFHYVRQVDSSKCDMTCSHHSLDECGGWGFITIYGIKSYYSQDLSEYSPKQCIYMTVQNKEDDPFF